MRKFTFLLAAASVALAAPAIAANLVVTPGTETAIPGNNNFKSQLNGLGLNFYTATGASVTLSSKATLTFEYIGSESGFRNMFAAGALNFQEMSTGVDPWNAAGTLIGSAVYSAGSITDWFFSSPGTATPGPFAIGTAQFGIFLPGGSGSYSAPVLYLGFDDQPGSDDDNHDDMIIRVTAVPFVDPGAIPEPSSWAMLIAGFGLVGAARRRRNKALTVTA